MANKKTLQQEADVFKSHPGAMILFVAQSVTNDELRSIAKFKWSCVYTSRTDLEVLKPFHAKGFLPRIPANPGELLYNSDEMSLVRVFQEDEEYPGDYFLDSDVFPSIQRLLKDGLNRLIVVGYDYAPNTRTGDVDFHELLRQRSMQPSSVDFWGISNPEMAASLERRGCTVHKEPLHELMQYIGNQEREYESIPASPYFFYADGKPIEAPENSALTPDTTLGVLTQRQIDLIRPNGKYECQLWFRNFLEYSSNVGEGHGPQWYAYSKRLQFNVTRNCEEALYVLVDQLLNGRKIGGKKYAEKDAGSVILAGDPGSGKSVTLAALAYRVFQEKKHPVVYVTGRQSRQSVIALMEKIKAACTDQNPKILLVWDCSAYRPQMREQQGIIDDLKGRFNRFVMVYSSYATFNNDDIVRRNFSYSQDHGFQETTNDFQETTNELRISMQTLERDDRVDYCFSLSRELYPFERDSLWNKLREHSSIDRKQLQDWQEKLKNTYDLFEICYKMITVLRVNYQIQLDAEHDVVSSYVMEVLEKILGYSSTDSLQKPDDIDELLADCGLSHEDLGLEKPDVEASISVRDRLREVDIRVAMFSQFERLDVPYSYIKNLLKEGCSGFDNVIYSSSSEDDGLFKLITTKIPWLKCVRNKQGEFTCAFRNSLEAEMFLVNHNATVDEQVRILENMLEYYCDCAYNYNPISSLFVKNLGKLLRNMGPNTKHRAFLPEGKREHEYKLLSQKMREDSRVLNILEEICDLDNEVDMHFVCDYITFVREYNTPQSSFDRISYDSLPKLKKAADIAYRYISEKRDRAFANNEYDHLNKRGGRSRSDGILETLRVEWVQCHRLISQYWIDYQNETPEECWCSEAKEWTASQYRDEYEKIYLHMSTVLDSDPHKGMYYNILFQTFLQMYDKFSEEYQWEAKIKLQRHLDDSEYYDLEHTKADSASQLRQNAKKILQKLNNTEYTVDAIFAYEKARDNGQEIPPEGLIKAFREDYESTLKCADPTILLLACRRELYICGALARPKRIGDSEIITDSMKTASAKVRQLLEAHYSQCVENSTYGLWLLLSAAWMEFSGGSIISRAAVRQSALSTEQWYKVYKWSAKYCTSMGTKAKADACLLYALSSYYVVSFDECSKVLDRFTLPIEDVGSDRQHHPYRLCKRDGHERTSIPRRYQAEVIQAERVIYVRVHITDRYKPRMVLNQFGVRKRYSVGDVLDVVVGVGYAGYNAYLAEADHKRGVSHG